MARTILVADDSPTVQKRASGILAGEGLDVVTVSNGVAAVKKMAAVKPLLVLADVVMPGKDGYEVCEFVKSSADLAHIPVVLIFSEMDAYEAARGAHVQADGTIRKPFDPNELIAMVSKFMAQAEVPTPKPVAPPPPVPAIVTEPVDEEPEIATVPEAPDFSAFSEGVAFATPAAEEVSATVQEPTSPQSPFVEAEASVEPAPAALEPVPEEALAPEPVPLPEPEPIQAGPVLVEEQAPAAVETTEPEPPQERTLLFHTPADIAQPVLSDELEPAMPGADAMSAEPLPSPAAETSAASRTLEGYTLDEAATGQVRMDSAGSGMPAQAQPQAASPPPQLDYERIYAIVHQVVVKMSPPAMTDQMIEQIARNFTDEIAADLNSEPS